jgi:signal transduction histidine kinase
MVDILESNPTHGQSSGIQQLDNLFGHLSAARGLYSKDTFLSLTGCITRILRDHPMQGLVITRTLGDAAFDTLTLVLNNRAGVHLYSLDTPPVGDSEHWNVSALPDTMGVLMVLTNRFCATLYWSSAPNDVFRMYEGGWTFHPADSRQMALQLAKHIGAQSLSDIIEATDIDRRYDDKLNLLLTSLVNGLENRNRELTLALAQVNDLNRKMVDTERLAAIGQLCSVIAHEIRNPLGLIDLYAKLVETQVGKLEITDEPAKEKLEQNLSLIRQSTVHLEDILSELTQYSRPLELKSEPTDIIALVEDIHRFYQPYYEEKGVQLALSESKMDTRCYRIDPGKIRQALINLLKNALEVSKTDSVVTLSIASRQNEPSVYIKVSDQGGGIDEKIMPKLFTPYFSTKGNGTGLGLAHTRKIMQAHGGTAMVLGTSPQGSTFALVLPKQLAVSEGS